MIKTRIFTLNKFFHAVYNNRAGWKINKDGNIELKDGNPIYVDTVGNELAMDGTTISRLNAESKEHREAKETVISKLKLFDGIDPVIAQKAIETVSKLDAKKLIDSGEVDKLTDQIKSQFVAQITEKDVAFSGLQKKFDDLQLTSAFAGSAFMKERVAVPAEMFQATFAKHFKVENGKISSIGADGNKIMSTKRIGEPADFEEALAKITDSYPHRDTILKAANQSGSGNDGSGGNRGGGKFISRKDFDRMSPIDQANAAQSMGKGEITITE